MVGDLVHAIVGNVEGGDPPFSCRRGFHIVHAYVVPDERPLPRQLSEHFGGHRRHVHQQPVGAGSDMEDFVLASRRSDDELDVLAQLVGLDHARIRVAEAVRHSHAKAYRTTLADPPFATRSTSASVAVLVSPAVVMASAPCAAPSSTARRRSSPVRSP